MTSLGPVPDWLDGLAEHLVDVARRRADDRAALRLLHRASQVNTVAERLRRPLWSMPHFYTDPPREPAAESC